MKCILCMIFVVTFITLSVEKDDNKPTIDDPVTSEAEQDSGTVEDEAPPLGNNGVPLVTTGDGSNTAADVSSVEPKLDKPNDDTELDSSTFKPERKSATTLINESVTEPVNEFKLALKTKPVCKCDEITKITSGRKSTTSIKPSKIADTTTSLFKTMKVKIKTKKSRPKTPKPIKITHGVSNESETEESKTTEETDTQNLYAKESETGETDESLAEDSEESEENSEPVEPEKNKPKMTTKNYPHGRPSKATTKQFTKRKPLERPKSTTSPSLHCTRPNGKCDPIYVCYDLSIWLFPWMLKECLKEKCPQRGPHEEYNSCETCEPYCGFEFKMFCTSFCKKGCGCKKGYCRNVYTGKCVRK